MNPWSIRDILGNEPVRSAHHVPDGLEWLPLVGLAVLAVAFVSAVLSRTPGGSGRNGSNDD